MHRIVERLATGDQYGHHPGLFGGKLQPPGGDEADAAGGFADHCGKPAMAQPFLHHREHVLPCLGEDQPIGPQANSGETGREQIGLAQHPQHRTIEPGEKAGNEQRGRGAVFGIRADGRCLVQGMTGQPPARQRDVDRGDMQGNMLGRWQAGPNRFVEPGAMMAFETGDAFPHRGNRGNPTPAGFSVTAWAGGKILVRCCRTGRSVGLIACMRA